MTNAFTLVFGKPTAIKDPDAILDYTIDFTEWLAGIADTIAGHAINVVGVVLESSVVDGGKVVMWISGGSPADEVSSATVRITTAAGRVDDRTVYFKIKDR